VNNGPYAGSPALTPAQQAVVDLPAHSLALVTAGAGAGKTHTLTRRLDALVTREELEAGEILVLSFSRAAVRELTERIDRHATAARRVRVQTFDSWASALLSQAYPDLDLTGLGYDGRIKKATWAIMQGAVAAVAGEQGPPLHLVIDEVQDLVGVRREMVETLIDELSAADNSFGFTLVGDAAQMVYGFQIANLEERAAETNLFFRWLRNLFGDELAELHLGENFRAVTDTARIALPYGPQLQRLPAEHEADTAEGERIHSELRGLLLEQAPDFGDLEIPFIQDALRNFLGTTAILCRDNGQVLQLSGRLNRLGIPHRLQRSVQERPAPAWLAGLLQTAEGASSLTEARFLAVAQQLALPEGTDHARLWRALRRAAAAPRNTLDLGKLRQAIVEGRLPDELTAALAHPLVLSTVHRAKGLEFDRVIIVEPEVVTARRPKPGDKTDYDPAAEARLLYVAMTRPRSDLYRLKAPRTRLLKKNHQLDRWIRRGRNMKGCTGIEIRELDVCHEYPAGLRDGGVDADPAAVQRYLEKSVHPGDAVELRPLHRFPEGPQQSIPYGIFHGEQPIGEVSERFRRDLFTQIRPARAKDSYDIEKWPLRIDGLRVEALETVAGTEAASERAGLGGAGVWLAPRLAGLAYLDWYGEGTPDDEDDETHSGATL
jgi:superfamily I DNA/RNA helicase